MALEAKPEPGFPVEASKGRLGSCKNPYYVWRAIKICTSEGKEFPNWVCRYLGGCAKKMMSAEAVAASDLRKVLPGIMGFSLKRGRGNLLKPHGEYLRYLDAAIRFGQEILKGARPKTALGSAFETLDVNASDQMDEKTLQSHIKKFFGVRNAPRTNAEWQEAIGLALSRTLDPLVRGFREIPS